MKIATITIALTVSMWTAVAIAAETVSQPTLTLEGANRVVAAAVNYARANKAPGGAIAVVDASGYLVMLERLDGSFPAGAEISIGKARTSVAFRRPTRALEETINKGRDAMIPVAAVTAFTPLQGGIPIVVDGQVIGGVGVSGAASAQQDEEVALAGAAAFSPNTPRAVVHWISAEAVGQAYRHGDTGDKLVAQDEFQVNASRRDRAGVAEVHAHDTDIFYIVAGSATVVTGGEIIEAHETAPGEIRGTALRGGETHSLSQGDVLTIPQGVPHWFKSVTTPFRYYVVKAVTAP
jgi:glc operon protein GlcG